MRLVSAAASKRTWPGWIVSAPELENASTGRSRPPATAVNRSTWTGSAAPGTAAFRIIES